MSTKDPIEDLFRENQNGLDEAPRSLLWDRIEERLDEKKVQKKKTQWWKYATAACLIGGISLAGFILINQNFGPKYKQESSAPIAIEMEMSSEKATEIFNKLEENKQSVATTITPKSAPDILEPEAKLKAAPASLVVPELQIEADVVYDVEMEKPNEPAAAMASAKAAPAKQEEIIVYRGATPEKKEGNYISKNKDLDDRRLGNMAEKSISYDTIYYEKIIRQLPIKLKAETIYFDLEKSTKDSMVFINPKIKHPNKFILIKDKNQNISVRFYGDRKKENSTESKEIQEFVRKNKIQIFGLDIQID